MWKSRRLLRDFQGARGNAWEARFWLFTLSTAPSFPQRPLRPVRMSGYCEVLPFIAVRTAIASLEIRPSPNFLPTDSAIDPLFQAG
jgi:hypothetical protein